MWIVFQWIVGRMAEDNIPCLVVPLVVSPRNFVFIASKSIDNLRNQQCKINSLSPKWDCKKVSFALDLFPEGK